MDIKKLAPWNWFQHEEEKKDFFPVRRSPRERRSELSSVQPFQEFDSIFDNMLDDTRWPLSRLKHSLTPLTGSDMIRPHVDIGANNKEYTITVEVPGVSEKDMTLELSGRCLIIKGEKRQEQENTETDYYRIERSYGSFYRTLTLPDDAEEENIEAKFKDGILTISVPRRDQISTDSKRIEIGEQE